MNGADIHAQLWAIFSSFNSKRFLLHLTRWWRREITCLFLTGKKKSFSHWPLTNGVTLSGLKLPLDKDTMFPGDQSSPSPPQTQPSPSSDTEEHQELFITASSLHHEIISVLFPSLILSCSLAHCCHGAPNRWHHRGKESVHASICVCVCVCVWGDKSWRLNEHGRRISGDEQKHRQQASSWSVHTQLPAHYTHTHTNTHGVKNTPSSSFHPPTRPAHTQPICHMRS